MLPPISCSGDDCDSYLFPGGLWSIGPALPSDSPPDSIVKIHYSPAVQMEFKKGIDERDQFLEQDALFMVMVKLRLE
jgi:hypothetical protein